MPFGLCNTPETFQCLMMLVLVGLHWTMCLTGTPFSYMRSYSKAKGRKWYWNEDCETSFQNVLSYNTSALLPKAIPDGC